MTERQAEIIGLIARGHTNKEIASQLGVSERAVKARASRLYRNFGVPNRAGLIARVMSTSASGRLDGNGHAVPAELKFAAYRLSPFVTVVTRGPAHVFAFVNERFERVTGQQSGNLVGRPMREALPGASDGWIERADEALRSGIAVTDAGLAPWHADGVAYRYVVQPLVDGHLDEGALLYLGVPESLA
jgi:DNA-binding CsgD family transcriptional regulator